MVSLEFPVLARRAAKPFSNHFLSHGWFRQPQSIRRSFGERGSVPVLCFKGEINNSPAYFGCRDRRSRLD